MNCRFLLDIVVRQCPSLFQLLPSKYKPLLVRRNALLVLNLALDHLDRICRFHFQRDCLASQCFHKNLHAQLFLNTRATCRPQHMPIENRIKDTPNMSLHLITEHNPYIVSMQGLLITKAPDTGAEVSGVQQPEGDEKDELQGAKNVSYVAAFYLPLDFKFIEPYLNMTDPIIRLLIPICMLNISQFKPTQSKSREFFSYFFYQEQVARKSTALSNLKKDFSEHAYEKGMQELRELTAKWKQKSGAEEQSAAEAAAAATSAIEEVKKEDKNDDYIKGWTCKLNRKSSISYDAVHVIFTHKNFGNENFYLFINKNEVEMNKKYLFVYCGKMQDFSLQIQRTPSADKAAIYLGLKQEMDDLYEKTKPDKEGVSYYECEETTDDGYWHDSAQRILKETTHENTTAMNKFVHAIAKRLFKVEYESHKKFTYNFKPNLHKFELDDEFHVIVRLQGGKPLIFFCSKDNQPNNCISCTKEHALGLSKEHALGLTSVPRKSPARPFSAPAASGVYGVSNADRADRAVLLSKAHERLKIWKAIGKPEQLRQLQAAQKPENQDPFPHVAGTRV